MKRGPAILAALVLFAMASSTEMAHAYGGGWYRGGPGGGWHGGAYYGGRGYYGGWGGRYWGPGVGVYVGGPAYWGGVPYAYSYPYGYGYAPYASYVVTDPVVVVEREVDVVTPPAQSNASQPAVQDSSSPPPTFWFYCTDPAGYYPYVQKCSKDWLPVVPQANTGSRTRPKLAR